MSKFTPQTLSTVATKDLEILEVILGVLMKTVSDHNNHFAQTEIDPAFADFAWHASAAAGI